MKVNDILKRNSFWLIASSLCSVMISCSVVSGTNVIAEQIDILTIFGIVDMEKTIYIVAPAILIATAAAFIKSKCIGRYSINVIRELQDAMVQHILKVKNDFWMKESTGKLLTKITSDISEIEKFTSATIPDFLGAVISILFVAVYVGTKNRYMLFVTAALYPVIILIMTFWGNVLKRLAQKRRGNIDNMTAQVVDCVNGIEIVKSYNLSPVFITKIENRIREILNNEYKRAWIMHFSQTMQRFLFCIPNMICPLIALLLVFKGEMTIGEMTAYIVLIHKIISHMKQLPFVITDAKEKQVSIDRINQILGAPLRKGSAFEFLSEDKIYLENVSFCYTEGKEVLKNISFQLERNKTYAFVGMSGQGKSTIFKLLSGLEEDYEGKCSINKNCAIVPQLPFIFAGTIAENIGIGCREAAMEDIVNAAKAAGIHEKIQGLEKQYHTVIGENGTGLSGGEKQRICIARALLSKADVLLLDEPTASIDAETEKIILNTLKALRGKKTIIWISHKLLLVQDADTIFVVDNGEIAEREKHEELVRLNGAYNKLWKMEA
ncbi:MAG: ABC transporter ATP-binding protein/permease [Bacteroidales bacterium]|nr:ABC transporter ATP-binding protein/permease [Lachnoclostridium sp.]MCM1384133.1 ABC transporter ATP-binding protein/permease [Lachnoclostridium sp.]MCM1464799.1 ABC transporter ATP-binding protein/permease [Bacteroidales bacterium]